MKKTAFKNKKIHHSSRRGLWKGSISFGLVNIPIYLESATQEKKISFHLIDKIDHAPVGYKQINKATGKEINKSSVVKGYEYEKGEFVLMTETDFKKANIKATNNIEIEDFVDLSEIDPMLFEKPYYVLPQTGGEKGYVLLREALKRTDKAAIAKIVLHTVQHLVCIMAREDYLILEIMRFANEVIEIKEARFIEDKIKKTHVSDKELSVAKQLVNGMTAKWNPQKYHDTYHDDLMKQINSKIKHGKTTTVEPVESAEPETLTNIVDLTALLKKSLSASVHKKKSAHGS